MAYWTMGLPQLRVSRTSSLSSVPALSPLNLTWAGSCARGAQLERELRAGSWWQFGRGWTHLVGGDAVLHGEKRGCLKRVKRQNSSSSRRRRLLIIAYICARSAARNSLASSFMYNLEIICVLKKQSTRPEYSGQQQQHEWLYF